MITRFTVKKKKYIFTPLLHIYILLFCVHKMYLCDCERNIANLWFSEDGGIITVLTLLGFQVNLRKKIYTFFSQDIIRNFGSLVCAHWFSIYNEKSESDIFFGSSTNLKSELWSREYGFYPAATQLFFLL